MNPVTLRVLICVVCVLLVLCPLTFAQQAERVVQAPRGSELNEATRVAIAKGLNALAARQQPNGAWRAMVGAKLNNSYQPERMTDHVGISALACLAFMAQGSLPGRGRYGDNVSRGLDFVLSHVKENGFISNGQSRMYSHAFATLFLAEVYGMTHREDLKEKLEKSCRLIVESQSVTHHGWRYQPYDKDSDMSVTVCQVQALRAARNNGIPVPKATIDNAIRYIRKQQVHHGRRNRGGFKYQPLDAHDQYNRVTPALTGAGLTALFGAGVYAGPEIDAGVAYLARNPMEPSSPFAFDYFYGNYYVGQAMFQVGGDHWHRWYIRVRDEIVPEQRPDGTWMDAVGPTYATAMACLILEMPYRYLPIFQR